eukprot:TRINITY_DN14341_c0_g1_i3.p1 TRINITY_DN14341_c0_g1~~TRINITY_DN14341_c0_g1_i3.p1  ORF type:complete len:491 (-),score=63.42 TRINITY_DN14341_c0_g1_i3:39-1511(-)
MASDQEEAYSADFDEMPHCLSPSISADGLPQSKAADEVLEEKKRRGTRAGQAIQYRRQVIRENPSRRWKHPLAIRREYLRLKKSSERPVPSRAPSDNRHFQERDVPTFDVRRPTSASAACSYDNMSSAANKKRKVADHFDIPYISDSSPSQDKSTDEALEEKKKRGTRAGRSIQYRRQVIEEDPSRRKEHPLAIHREYMRLKKSSEWPVLDFLPSRAPPDNRHFQECDVAKCEVHKLISTSAACPYEDTGGAANKKRKVADDFDTSCLRSFSMTERWQAFEQCQNSIKSHPPAKWICWHEDYWKRWLESLPHDDWRRRWTPKEWARYESGNTHHNVEPTSSNAKVTLSPFDVLFTQDCISPVFSSGKHKNKSIDSTIEEVMEGSSKLEDFPNFDVFEVDGRLYACTGNRRLYIWRVLACMGVIKTITVVVHSRDDPLMKRVRHDRRHGAQEKWERHLSSERNGLTVRITRQGSNYSHLQAVAPCPNWRSL